MARFIVLTLMLLLTATPGFAQKKREAVPDVPEALQALAERGAQLRYLGSEHGMEGWIAIYQGQEQYYYVTQDKKAFVTGLMFGNDGRPITIEQVKQLQAQSGDVLDLLTQDKAAPEEAVLSKTPESVVGAMNTKSPGERMFAGIEGGNWVRLGREDAPVIYSFIDPNCLHCHEFIQDLRKNNAIADGRVQVRLVPVGFLEGSLPQAALLLASPDAESMVYKYLDGDKNAIPAKNDISTQAVQKNMALMQAWKFNVTPLTVYRSAAGEVKIVKGRPRDLQAILSDLPPVGMAAAPVAAPSNATAVSP